jgi:hypothetical protein
MARLIERILSFITPILLFSPSIETKAAPKTNDIDSITNLNQIKLVPDSSPLLLKLSNQNNQILFAAHRSHASHASHSSHYSGSSGSYSTSPQETTPSTSPSEESSSSKKTTPAKITPSTTKSEEPSSSSAWKSTTEWRKNPNKLFYHDVIITLESDSVIQGLVTDSNETSIQLKTNETSVSTKTNWIEIKNIKNLIWR